MTVTDKELERVERFLDTRLSKLESTIETALQSLVQEDKNLSKDIQTLSVDLQLLKKERETERKWIAIIGGAAGFLLSTAFQIVKLILDA